MSSSAWGVVFIVGGTWKAESPAVVMVVVVPRFAVDDAGRESSVSPPAAPVEAFPSSFPAEPSLCAGSYDGSAWRTLYLTNIHLKPLADALTISHGLKESYIAYQNPLYLLEDRGRVVGAPFSTL